MTQIIYTFDYPLFFNTKFGEVKIVKHGYIDISFQDIDPSNIDSILEEFSENIKYKIKEQYSIKVNRRNCFEKKKWYQWSIKPIALFNFKKYCVPQPFKDDKGRFDFGMTLTINNAILEEFRLNNNKSS